jgi:L-aminopeptidase/D-esterase-like protein
MVERIHAVMLSGGSAYGLDAAGGAMKYLEERKIGFDVGVGVVPIVVGACIFDLGIGKADVRPDAAMGYTACKNAGAGPVAVGNVGAGTGAQVGQYLGPERTMKSGLGAYAVDLGGVKVGAIVAVNCMGDVFDIDTGKVIAGILTEDKTDIDNTERIMFEEIKYNRDVWSGANTTIGCIITNAKLTKTQASRLATVAHNGLAQAIRPVHTSADGDTIFVMANGDYEVNPDSLGALATEVMARAINRAVRSAESAYGRPAASDFSR